LHVVLLQLATLRRLLEAVPSRLKRLEICIKHWADLREHLASPALADLRTLGLLEVEYRDSEEDFKPDLYKEEGGSELLAECLRRAIAVVMGGGVGAPNTRCTLYFSAT
jgi:hypothetical protein